MVMARTLADVICDNTASISELPENVFRKDSANNMRKCDGSNEEGKLDFGKIAQVLQGGRTSSKTDIQDGGDATWPSVSVTSFPEDSSESTVPAFQTSSASAIAENNENNFEEDDEFERQMELDTALMEKQEANQTNPANYYSTESRESPPPTEFPYWSPSTLSEINANNISANQMPAEESQDSPPADTTYGQIIRETTPKDEDKYSEPEETTKYYEQPSEAASTDEVTESPYNYNPEKERVTTEYKPPESPYTEQEIDTLNQAYTRSSSSLELNEDISANETEEEPASPYPITMEPYSSTIFKPPESSRPEKETEQNEPDSMLEVAAAIEAEVKDLEADVNLTSSSDNMHIYL